MEPELKLGYCAHPPHECHQPTSTARDAHPRVLPCPVGPDFILPLSIFTQAKSSYFRVARWHVKSRLIATELSILWSIRRILIDNCHFFCSLLVSQVTVYHMQPGLGNRLTQDAIHVHRKVVFVISIFPPNLTKSFGFLNFLARNSISFQCPSGFNYIWLCRRSSEQHPSSISLLLVNPLSATIPTCLKVQDHCNNNAVGLYNLKGSMWKIKRFQKWCWRKMCGFLSSARFYYSLRDSNSCAELTVE